MNEWVWFTWFVRIQDINERGKLRYDQEMLLVAGVIRRRWLGMAGCYR